MEKLYVRVLLPLSTVLTTVCSQWGQYYNANTSWKRQYIPPYPYMPNYAWTKDNFFTKSPYSPFGNLQAWQNVVKGPASAAATAAYLAKKQATLQASRQQAVVNSNRRNINKAFNLNTPRGGLGVPKTALGVFKARPNVPPGKKLSIPRGMVNVADDKQDDNILPRLNIPNQKLISAKRRLLLSRGRLSVPRGKLSIPQRAFNVPRGRFNVPPGGFRGPLGAPRAPMGRVNVPNRRRLSAPRASVSVPRRYVAPSLRAIKKKYSMLNSTSDLKNLAAKVLYSSRDPAVRINILKRLFTPDYSRIIENMRKKLDVRKLEASIPVARKTIPKKPYTSSAFRRATRPVALTTFAPLLPLGRDDIVKKTILSKPVESVKPNRVNVRRTTENPFSRALPYWTRVYNKLKANKDSTMKNLISRKAPRNHIPRDVISRAPLENAANGQYYFNPLSPLNPNLDTSPFESLDDFNIPGRDYADEVRRSQLAKIYSHDMYNSNVRNFFSQLQQEPNLWEKLFTNENAHGKAIGAQRPTKNDIDSLGSFLHDMGYKKTGARGAKNGRSIKNTTTFHIPLHVPRVGEHIEKLGYVKPKGRPQSFQKNKTVFGVADGDKQAVNTNNIRRHNAKTLSAHANDVTRGRQIGATNNSRTANAKKDNSLSPHLSARVHDEEKRRGTDSILHHDGEKRRGTDSIVHNDEEKQRSTDIFLHHDKEKRRGTNSIVHHDEEKRRGTDSILHHEEEKGQASNNILHHEEEKRRGTNSSLHNDEEKERGTDSSLHNDEGKERGTNRSLHNNEEKQRSTNTIVHNDEERRQGTNSILHNDETKKEKNLLAHAKEKLKIIIRNSSREHMFQSKALTDVDWKTGSMGELQRTDSQLQDHSIKKNTLLSPHFENQQSKSLISNSNENEEMERAGEKLKESKNLTHAYEKAKMETRASDISTKKPHSRNTIIVIAPRLNMKGSARGMERFLKVQNMTYLFGRRNSTSTYLIGRSGNATDGGGKKTIIVISPLINLRRHGGRHKGVTQNTSRLGDATSVRKSETHDKNVFEMSEGTPQTASFSQSDEKHNAKNTQQINTNTTSKISSADQITGDRRTPSETTGDRRDLSETTDDRLGLSEITDNQDDLSEATGDRRSLLETTGEKRGLSKTTKERHGRSKTSKVSSSRISPIPANVSTPSTPTMTSVEGRNMTTYDDYLDTSHSNQSSNLISNTTSSKHKEKQNVSLATQPVKSENKGVLLNSSDASEKKHVFTIPFKPESNRNVSATTYSNISTTSPAAESIAKNNTLDKHQNSTHVSVVKPKLNQLHRVPSKFKTELNVSSMSLPSSSPQENKTSHGPRSGFKNSNTSHPRHQNNSVKIIDSWKPNFVPLPALRHNVSTVPMTTSVDSVSHEIRSNLTNLVLTQTSRKGDRVLSSNNRTLPTQYNVTRNASSVSTQDKLKNSTKTAHAHKPRQNASGATHPADSQRQLRTNRNLTTTFNLTTVNSTSRDALNTSHGALNMSRATNTTVGATNTSHGAINTTHGADDTSRRASNMSGGTMNKSFKNKTKSQTMKSGITKIHLKSANKTVVKDATKANGLFKNTTIKASRPFTNTSVPNTPERNALLNLNQPIYIYTHDALPLANQRDKTNNSTHNAFPHTNQRNKVGNMSHNALSNSQQSNVNNDTPSDVFNATTSGSKFGVRFLSFSDELNSLATPPFVLRSQRNYNKKYVPGNVSISTKTNASMSKPLHIKNKHQGEEQYKHQDKEQGKTKKTQGASLLLANRTKAHAHGEPKETHNAPSIIRLNSLDFTMRGGNDTILDAPFSLRSEVGLLSTLTHSNKSHVNATSKSHTKIRNSDNRDTITEDIMAEETPESFASHEIRPYQFYAVGNKSDGIAKSVASQQSANVDQLEAKAKAEVGKTESTKSAVKNEESEKTKSVTSRQSENLDALEAKVKAEIVKLGDTKSAIKREQDLKTKSVETSASRQSTNSDALETNVKTEVAKTGSSIKNEESLQAKSVDPSTSKQNATLDQVKAEVTTTEHTQNTVKNEEIHKTKSVFDNATTKQSANLDELEAKVKAEIGTTGKAKSTVENEAVHKESASNDKVLEDKSLQQRDAQQNPKYTKTMDNASAIRKLADIIGNSIRKTDIEYDSIIDSILGNISTDSLGKSGSMLNKQTIDEENNSRRNALVTRRTPAAKSHNRKVVTGLGMPGQFANVNSNEEDSVALRESRLVSAMMRAEKSGSRLGDKVSMLPDDKSLMTPLFLPTSANNERRMTNFDASSDMGLMNPYRMASSHRQQQPSNVDEQHFTHNAFHDAVIPFNIEPPPLREDTAHDFSNNLRHDGISKQLQGRESLPGPSFPPISEDVYKHAQGREELPGTGFAPINEDPSKHMQGREGAPRTVLTPFSQDEKEASKFDELLMYENAVNKQKIRNGEKDEPDNTAFPLKHDDYEVSETAQASNNNDDVTTEVYDDKPLIHTLDGGDDDTSGSKSYAKTHQNPYPLNKLHESVSTDKSDDEEKEKAPRTPNEIVLPISIIKSNTKAYSPRSMNTSVSPPFNSVSVMDALNHFLPDDNDGDMKKFYNDKQHSGEQHYGDRRNEGDRVKFREKSNEFEDTDDAETPAVVRESEKLREAIERLEKGWLRAEQRENKLTEADVTKKMLTDPMSNPNSIMSPPQKINNVPLAESAENDAVVGPITDESDPSRTEMQMADLIHANKFSRIGNKHVQVSKTMPFTKSNYKAMRKPSPNSRNNMADGLTRDEGGSSLSTKELLTKIGDIDEATNEIVSNARKAGKQLDPSSPNNENANSESKGGEETSSTSSTNTTRRIEKEEKETKEAVRDLNLAISILEKKLSYIEAAKNNSSDESGRKALYIVNKTASNRSNLDASQQEFAKRTIERDEKLLRMIQDSTDKYATPRGTVTRKSRKRRRRQRRLRHRSKSS